MELLASPLPPSPLASPSPTSSSSTAFSTAAKPRQKRKRARNADGAEPSAGSGRRSSIYRGVTKHRLTGRYEAHLWDKNCWNLTQNKKGRQVYLGAYDEEEAAGHTYDLAALKYWGPTTTLNFPANTYLKEYEAMKGMSKEEYLASLRRNSSGFSRGVSKYRGVARHHQNGRWEARIGRVLGNKYLYLGTFNTQEEAAEAYDMAAIQFRGAQAVTNFDVSRYARNYQPPPPPLPPVELLPPPPPSLPLLYQPFAEGLSQPLRFLQLQSQYLQPLPQPQPLQLFYESSGLGLERPELELVPMEGSMNTIDQLLDPESLGLGAGFDMYPLPDFSPGIKDLFGDDFEENIEHLFEGDELLGGSSAGSDDGGSLTPEAMQVVSASLPAQIGQVTYPLPMGICS